MPENVQISVLLVDDAADARSFVRSILEAGAYSVREADNALDGLAAAIDERPDLILLDGRVRDLDRIEILRRLRDNLVTQSIPVIVLTDEAAVDEGAADDYVVKPFEPDELLARVESTLSRSRGGGAIDPLTGLPANPAIHRELSRRLDAGCAFTLCYADLNHFTAYVDAYGHEAAGRVIGELGRLCRDAVSPRRQDGGFAGHVGDDDFVLLTRHDDAQALTVELIHAFENLLPDFYTHEHLKRGYVRGTDRYGSERAFPLLSLSVALVDVVDSCLLSARALVEFAARCKDAVKVRGESLPERWQRFDAR